MIQQIQLINTDKCLWKMLSTKTGDLISQEAMIEMEEGWIIDDFHDQIEIQPETIKDDNYARAHPVLMLTVQ